MALKDIKNDPSVSSGLKRPLSSLKRRMSDSSLQYKSRFGKGDLEKEIDGGSEENMNICTELTNTAQVLQDKERNEGFLCKAQISVQGALKKNDGIVSPVLVKEHLPPMPQETPYSSPDSQGISNMSQSFFADPTDPNEKEQESAEISSFNSDKYFSTPMPSIRVKKKLTPVMEVDFESNMSEEWPQLDTMSRVDTCQKNFADVLSRESPTNTPLYRSFFAAECQEIVNQIENLETDVKRSPGKRKAEECDVSTIDAEPPPYDTTPMKSMLACEVATMLRSLESSPVKEGLLFGESLLDLEKTDMQLDDFDLSECSIKNNKVSSVGDSEGLSVLRDRLDGVCVKRQKMGPLEKIYSGVYSVHLVNKMSPLPNGLPKLTPEMPATESVCATNKYGDEGITAVITNNVHHTEHKISDHVTEPDLLVQGTAVAPVVSQVIKASLQALVSTTKSLTPAHEGSTTACIKQLSKTEEHKLCANTTQDIVNYDEMPPTTANVTQVIEILSHISNTTQDLPCSQEEVNIANTTQVIEVPSGNTTQDIVSMNDGAMSGNTTQVMEVVSPPANTTQDVTPMHEMVATANSTQIIELGPQFPENTTQDIIPMHESKMADKTHEIEVVPQSSLNATQDVASVPVLTANVTQDIGIVPEASPSRAQGTSSTPNKIIATSCTEDVRGMQNSSMEGLSADEATSTRCIDAVPSVSCNAKESFETPHNDKMPTNNHLFGGDTQPSLNMVLDVQVQHGIMISDIIVPGTTGTDTEMSILNQELNAEKKKDLVPPNDHKNGSKLDQTRETLVGVDMKELLSVEPEAQTSVVDLTHVSIDPCTLVSPPAQAKLSVTEGQKLEGYEEPCSNSCTEMASSQKEVDVCKESRTQPFSESCSMIQEEENTHDVSVFSVGSLSFVTSTPVPGLSNFPFQKTCRESRQQDLNVSMGSVLDDSANKVPKQQGIVTIHKSHDAQGLNLNDKEKQTTHGSYLPPSMQRSIAPPSEAVPKSIPSTSGIPSARRSLALCQNANQNPGRELSVSKIAPRGIPGRGIIRPPMARQSLPRPSLGNLKQAVEGTSITNKPIGNRFRTPKVAAAIVKLPAGTSSIKPPSRFGAPGSTGRLSIQNVGANLPNTQSTKTVSSVRPPISTGIRSGLPRPGASSIRSPLPHAQKVSLKDKAQIQGLPTKKNQRELPTLRRETGSKAEGSSVVRSTAKQATLALDVTKEASSLQASIQDGASQNHTVQTKAESSNVVQSSLSSKQETASITATSTESATAGDERCQHLEICKFCHEKYHKLLQEFEDFKRRFDHIQHTQVEMTDMADT